MLVIMSRTRELESKSKSKQRKEQRHTEAWPAMPEDLMEREHHRIAVIEVHALWVTQSYYILRIQL